MGITYITELQDRHMEENWHINFPEKPNPFGEYSIQFECMKCNVKFKSKHELENHYFTKHNFKMPSIYVNGKKQSYIINLKHQSNINKIVFENVVQIYVKLKSETKFKEIIIKEFSDILKNFKNVEVKLKGSNGVEAMHLVTLNEIEREEIEIISNKFVKNFTNEIGFSWEEIINFENLSKTSENSNYIKALCNYLRGLKYRDKDFDVKNIGIEHADYTFNLSLSELKFYDDTLSKVIVSIINLSKVNFSLRYKTSVYMLDYVMDLFFEIKEYGSSFKSFKLKNELKKPIAPVDKSITTFFQLISCVDYQQFKFKYKDALGSKDFLKNEKLLSKIYFIWKFGRDDTVLRSEIIDELSHNYIFSKFVENQKKF